MTGNKEGREASLSSTDITCPNCQTTFQGKFCHECGQKRENLKASWKMLISELLQTLFFLDMKLLYTLEALVLRPGKFVRNYLKGEQVNFAGPVQFFILSLGIYLFLFLSFSETFFAYINDSLIGENNETESLLRFERLKAYLKVNLNYLYFVLPPVFAFYFKLVIGKADYTYAESLVAAFYWVALAIVYNTLVLLLGIINTNFFALRVLIVLALLPFMLMQLNGKYSIQHYTRSLFVTLLAYLSYALVVGAITLIAMGT